MFDSLFATMHHHGQFSGEVLIAEDGNIIYTAISICQLSVDEKLELAEFVSNYMTTGLKGDGNVYSSIGELCTNYSPNK